MNDSYRNFRIAASDKEEVRLEGGPADGQIEEVLTDAIPREDHSRAPNATKYHYVPTDRTDEEGRRVFKYDGEEVGPHGT